MITSLLSEEMYQTEMMYLVYSKGYNQGVAYTNTCLHAYFVPRQFRVVTPKAARILVDSGLAQVMSRAYYCARSELVCSWGSRVDVRGGYLSIRGLVK